MTVVTGTGVSPTSPSDLFAYFPATNPAITGLSVSTGPTAGGKVVMITGSHFTGVTSVMFGNVPVSHFVIGSDSSITAIAPPEAAGTVDVTVSTANATSVDVPADQFTYVAPPLPLVAGLSQTTGRTSGGTVVTITGSGFTGTTSVVFGTVPATKFTVLSDTALIVTTPAEASGKVDVTVTSAGGTSMDTSADQFTYQAPLPVVLNLTPSTGPTSGGSAVTILGTGFTAATAVSFGSLPAISFTVLSDNVISAIAPAEKAGPVDVSVTTAGGQSALSSNDHFTFTLPPPPVVTGLSPASGSTPGGTVVIIGGMNFTGATLVDFGNVADTSFTVNSDTQITVVAPAEMPGPVDVTVTTPEGVSSVSGFDTFNYTPVIPAVTALSPAAGPLSGNTSITITGSGFLGAKAVTFGLLPALSFNVVSDSTLIAVAPEENAGTVDVSVSTAAGQSLVSPADQYTFVQPPMVNFFYPFSDTASGGVPITITGSGFTGTTAVFFGSTPATAFTVNSDTSITVTTPAHSAGSAALSVVAPGGQSTSVSFTYNAANTVTWTGSNGDWETPSNWSGGVLPGTGDDVVIPAGVTVTHSNGADIIHQLTANGTLALTGGTLIVNATGTLASLSISGGSLGGTEALTVTGAFTWGGGALLNSTPLSLQGTSSLVGNLALDGTILNNGSATWTGDGTLQFTGGTWNNEAGSVFTTNSNGSQQNFAGTGVFTNSGTLLKTGTSPTSFQGGVAFNNPGTLTISQGALTLSGGTSSGSISVAGGAQLVFGNSFTLTDTSSISGGGTVTVSGGILALGGTVSASGGLTIAQGAMASGQAIINADVTNNGTLSDGGIVGVLTINGNYTQSSTGTLNLTIALTPGGTGFDQVRIAGMATLGGLLNVSTTGGFLMGAVFPVITWGSVTGTFGSVQFLGPTLQTQYNSANLDLLSMADSPHAETPCR